MFLNWFKKYHYATRSTKVFVWNCILYGVLLLGTTAYCYGRLEFIHSYKTEVKPTLIPN